MHYLINTVTSEIVNNLCNHICQHIFLQRDNFGQMNLHCTKYSALGGYEVINFNINFGLVWFGALWSVFCDTRAN